MQPISPPQGAENPQGYTRSEILRVLRGHEGSRTFSFRYNLLDTNNNLKDDVTDIVTDAVIDQNWLAPIKRTADFEILGSGDERIDYLSDRLQPWIRLHMPRKLVPVGTEVNNLWLNTFDAASGAVTPENSTGTGDSLSRINNTVNYDGVGFMRLGADDGSDFGSASFGIKSRDTLKYVVFVDIPSGGNFTVALDGQSTDTTRWLRLDNTFGTYLLGSIDVSDHIGNIFGGLIRIEMTFNGRQARWQIFWSDPFGTTPDFSETEDASDWGRLQLFQMSGGGFGSSPASVGQFEVLVLSPPEYEPFITPLWSNNFVEPSGGGALTPEDLGRVGNTPQAVGGDTQFSTVWSIDGNGSGQLGLNGEDPGWVQVRIPPRVSWRTTFFGYIPTSGRLMLLPMNDETFVDPSQTDPTTVSPAPGPWIRLDDGANVWTVAGTDVSAFSDLLVETPFRVEMEVVNGEYFWRIYTADPQGRSPDIAWSGSTDSDWDDIKWFTFWGGGNFNASVFVDSITIGTPQPTLQEIPESENYVEWPQGVFAMSSPKREIDRNGVITRMVEGYDVIQTITDDKLEDRLVVTAGTRYLDVVNELLGDRPKIVTPSGTSAARDREWPVGYSIRQTINDMLASINYESISADERGNFVVRPYILPDRRTPEFNYLDDEDSVIMPGASQELDLFNVPNKWVLTVTNPDLPPMRAVLTNNDPQNPTSTVRRNQTIVDFRQEEDSPSQAALMRKAQRHAWAASRKFEGVEFETLMMPFHSGNDCYNIRYQGLGVDEKYLEHYWILRLRAGEKMQHRGRRVVDFNPNDDTFHMNNVQINGALDAKNIHAGILAVTPVVNTPTMALVTGFELAGSGSINIQVTIESTAPQNARQVSTQMEGPRSFQIWFYRITSPTTNIHYFATRNP